MGERVDRGRIVHMLGQPGSQKGCLVVLTTRLTGFLSSPPLSSPPYGVPAIVFFFFSLFFLLFFLPLKYNHHPPPNPRPTLLPFTHTIIPNHASHHIPGDNRRQMIAGKPPWTPIDRRSSVSKFGAVPSSQSSYNRPSAPPGSRAPTAVVCMQSHSLVDGTAARVRGWWRSESGLWLRNASRLRLSKAGTGG
ncbi:hypothetical protein B0I73DRAFT_36368 [Yarrowia lipolytica]|uniref:Uncharacterized protein n=1 Tax=Yarrowia lipolytica TaxID=4952 RepID=A0A371BZ43_YARLL|nr:hypothetical protein B0I71DRAFT_13684 [Yarrowia lipolytica]RDW39301.1 hypothetical protein B0I73DRAFT_36368 [Yarrowia lipolytica]RDW51182.1 hypothetical protein B0I75DRAFT_45366 [Yarrowia lipolytica]